jgi:hypothetical protein
VTPIRIRFRTFMIAVYALAVAMVVVRIVVLLCATGRSVRIDGSNVLVGFDVWSEPKVDLVPAAGSFGSQIYMVFPTNFILILVISTISLLALAAGWRPTWPRQLKPRRKSLNLGSHASLKTALLSPDRSGEPEGA